ncbi:alpha/beta hydrolase [Campylobacter sp. CCS1377]|uniref:Alpha/beta hydrolase n=1 Tax=Campylobacter sp. CCS1377 TaxID=3158229 RepID=A0AAU7E6W0_9BACT
MALTTLAYNNKNYQISYELINNNQIKSILVLHGWGANKELMKQTFSKVLKDFNQIYLDLPGFGNSTIEEILNSKDYANIVLSFLKNKNLHPDIFMGHSFGGKICTLLLNKNIYPSSLLILLSSAGIVAKKSFKTRCKIKLFKILKKLGFAHLYKYFASKDGANLSPLMYETFKKVVDENCELDFAKIQNPTLIFWGIEDKATPLESGKKIYKLIPHSQFFTFEGDHFFFLQNAQKITQIIRNNHAK